MPSRVAQRTEFRQLFHDLLELVGPATPLHRTCGVMLLAAFTSLACVALLTLPGAFFHNPNSDFLVVFWRSLQIDPTLFVPICLSVFASALSLALPVPRRVFHPIHSRCTSKWSGSRLEWRG